MQSSSKTKRDVTANLLAITIYYNHRHDFWNKTKKSSKIGQG